MSRLGNLRLPSLNAAVNVASQAFRQFVPERTGQTQPAERVRFAQVNNVEPCHDAEHHELSNMTSTNPFLSPPMKQSSAEDSFNQGYQSGATVKDQRPSMTSIDFSEGSDFAEGKSDVKINEYQAAWNVTNAIQVGIYYAFLIFIVIANSNADD